MKKPVRWLSNALDNFTAIIDYTRENRSPSDALKLIERVEKSTEILSHYPEIGRVGEEGGTRRLAVSNTPFFIVYYNAPEEIQIWRILHGSQLYP